MIIFEDIIDSIMGLGKIGLAIFVGVIIIGVLGAIASNIR